jgi:altronate hydrolase
LVGYPYGFLRKQKIGGFARSFGWAIRLRQKKAYQNQALKLIDLYKAGADTEDILEVDLFTESDEQKSEKLFPNVDGIKF